MELFVWHFNLQFPYFCQHICSNKCFMKIFFTFINSIHSINLLFLQIASSSWLSGLLRLKTAKGSCWWRTKFRLYTSGKGWQGNKETEQQAPSQSHPSLPDSRLARQNKTQMCAKNKRKWVQGFVSFHPYDIGWLHLCKGGSSVNEKERSFNR